MKYTALILGVVFALALTVPVLASGNPPPGVFCIGTACQGEEGDHSYEYKIQSSPVEVNVFRVATGDSNSDHYTNWLMPENWTVDIEPISDDHNVAYVPHGETIGSDGECGWSIVWRSGSSGNAITDGLFGFDNAASPHEVSWEINATAVTSDWNESVGMGAGPVHAPVPEPGSVLSLSSGLIGLAGFIIRRRYK